MSDLSWLNPTPHTIAVYASRPLSPATTQHSLPSGRYPVLGPDFHRLDRTSLRLAHLFDHLVGAGAKLEASQPTHGFTGNQQNASLRTVPRVHSGNVRLVVGLRSRPSGESRNNRQRRPEIGGLSQRGTAMTASDTSTKLRLDPPGPGSWEQDPVHFPRPMTRYFQETHPPSFKRGTNDFARFYGMLIDGLQMSYVKGFGYNQVLPAPDAEIPQRFQRAEQVFAQKLWREQLRDWD